MMHNTKYKEVYDPLLVFHCSQNKIDYNKLFKSDKISCYQIWTLRQHDFLNKPSTSNPKIFEIECKLMSSVMA